MNSTNTTMMNSKKKTIGTYTLRIDQHSIDDLFHVIYDANDKRTLTERLRDNKYSQYWRDSI